MTKPLFSLASAVLAWQRLYGRQDLPWQNSRDPYRVWLSEIMLQQTQVVTVVGYYQRFLAELPDVRALAQAPLDQVLRLWAGLGYYSRARHLHHCAQEIVALHGGVFPGSAKLLQTLPGIGRSTAAAIASLCFDERVAILDGNVKRVLSRFFTFDADLALAANARKLWDLATQVLPPEGEQSQMPTYTQGMMDLGATLCTAKSPQCQRCPLAPGCGAHAYGETGRYPVKSRKLQRSTQSIWMLWVQSDDDALWLSQRPTPGVWAGLYCFAIFDDLPTLLHALPKSQEVQHLPMFKHVLTHKDLYLHPVKVLMPSDRAPVAPGRWFSARHWPQLGLPAPIAKLLDA